jgi:hypothetical protein
MNLIKGNVYGVGTGSFVGEMFVFIEETQDTYEFISIPKNENRSVPKHKFNFGIKNKIIEFAEEIDKDVLNLLEKQFVFNKNLDK